MDIKNIKEIISVFENSKLNKLEIEEDKLSIKMEKGSSKAVSETIKSESICEINDKEKDIVYFNNLYEVKSPIVGVFYQSSDPESQPFVSKGTKVKKGDVLCIIEAMKVMNEITAEKDGEIVDVCVTNGQLVEYSQVLFRLK